MMDLAAGYGEPASHVVAWGCRILIQSTLLIGMGSVVCGLLRHRSAALRSAVLRGTLLAVLVCPIIGGICGPVIVDIPIPQGLHAASASPTPAPRVHANSDHLSAGFRGPTSGDTPDLVLTTPPEASRWPMWASLPMLYVLLSVCWAMGTMLLLSRLGYHYLRARRVRSSADPGPEHAVRICREVAARMEMKAPDVMVIPMTTSPLLMGVLRPVVLLPAAHPAMANIQVFAHELAHLRRQDCLWNALCQLAAILCFFQPLVWMLARWMEQTNEEACDDFVLFYAGRPRAYARRLVEMAELLGCCVPEGIGLGAVNLRSSLGRRVQRILSPGAGHAVWTGRSETLLVVLLGGAAVFGVGLLGVHAAASSDTAGLVSDTLSVAEALDPNVLLLVAGLSDHDWQRREQAAIVLAQRKGTRPAAIPALIEALSDDEWRVRKAAAAALMTTGPAGRDAVPALIAALADEEWQVRRPAAEALAVMGPTAEPAVPALSSALRDEEWQVRRAAATALAGIGPASWAAIPGLLGTLDDEEWHVREDAALALGAIGPKAAAAIPALIKRLDDPEWRVRRAVAGALETIAVGDKTAIPEIIDSLLDTEWKRRQATARSLERLLEE